MKFFRQLVKGLWEEIPVFRVVLGMCPTIAVTTSVENAIGMGLATTFVLIGSNVAISSLRATIPEKVRIPCYIVVAATFVTVVDLVMNAYAPELHRALGIFVPLIVVNCIILGRAEAFAGKNGVWLSLADGIGMGVGFTIALIVTGAIREISGNGTLTVWGDWRWNAGGFNPALLMVLAPGGFITLGWILGVMNHIQAGIARAGGRVYTAPPGFDCRHCIQCRIGGEGRP